MTWFPVFAWGFGFATRADMPERFVWGPGVFCALALLFVTSVWVRRPGPLQRFALKSPDELPRIRGALNIVTLASGMTLLIGGVTALLWKPG